jgi:hypothetical protein
MKNINSQSDEYRNKVASNAYKLLTGLFAKTTIEFHHLKAINILVIGAGIFPSFAPLIKVLIDKSFDITEFNFTLVEPIQTQTDIFLVDFNEITTHFDTLIIKVFVKNIDIKEYLKTTFNEVFDIVYFEQPDFFPLDILLAREGRAQSAMETSLRESIPYLAKILKEKSIIIASFLYKHDLSQLDSLISFSLNLKTQHFYLKKPFLKHSYYNAGLISQVDSGTVENIKPDRIEYRIKIFDTIYCLFLISSLIIFFLTAAWAKPMSALFLIAMLLYHRYNIVNFLWKISFLLLQFLILTKSMNWHYFHIF